MSTKISHGVTSLSRGNSSQRDSKVRQESVGESQKALKLVGREKEKEDIVDQLIYFSRSRSSVTPVPVITIVGLAGIGKTTLAQLVCEDEKVKNQVGLPVWVKGNTFDADSIAKQAIGPEETAAATISPTTKNLDIIVILDDRTLDIEDKDVKALQDKVKENWRVEIESKEDLKALKDKLKEHRRVEIEKGMDEEALKDKLKEEYGVEIELEGMDLKALQDKLMEALCVKIEGMDLKALQNKLIEEAYPRVTAIMITTRSYLVAMAKKIIGSPVKSYPLAGLNEEESLSLFKAIRGRGAGDDSCITEDEKKILVQCRGVPMAIEKMTEVLNSPSRSTELTKDFLTKLLECFFPVHRGDPIRLCFAYCSLFPKDYLFDAERLIHLWKAEGFLKSSELHEYLMDLVGRSIFQDVKKDEHGQVRSCRMHPLMHDIATFLAANEKITVDSDGKVLRASLDLSLDFSSGIPATLSSERGKNLKSLLFSAKTQSRLPLQVEMSTPMLENIFKSCSGKLLGVLDLRGLKITAVPNSIGELKDLKYLDLSQNDMDKLPSSIAKLSKLQTLKLSRCYLLKELPKDFQKLNKLEHLDIEGCLGLTGMPPQMSTLSTLQTLTAFVASKKEGLEELAKLNQLRGYLEIMYLDRVAKPSGKTNGKYLMEKQHLQSLKLKWDLGDENRSHHLSILNCLEPHSLLEVLILEGYRGEWLSTWLTSFQSLVKLSLQDCHGCKYLSQQDQLPKLKILELVRLENLCSVVEECDKKQGLVFYENLKELTIEDCPKLKSWWRTEIAVNERPVFASISKLRVRHCPELTCMPRYPRLGMVRKGSSSTFGKELVLVDSKLELLLDTKSCVDDAEGIISNNSIPLENLHILNCNIHLENLSEDPFKNLSSLQRLTIENCNLDGQSNQWEGLKSLRFLTLREIPNLRSLSFGDSVATLRELTLHSCHGLTSISDSMIGNLTSLRELSLHNCHGLTSISDSIDNVTSLRRLEISKCNKLKSLPKTMEKLKSLKTLIILNCDLLLPRCQPETGDDWPQIRHIAHIQLK